jgi:hypothetical protein
MSFTTPGFTDSFDFSWEFSTGDGYEGQFSFDPIPQESSLFDSNFTFPPHRRTNSARSYESSEHSFESNRHKRAESDSSLTTVESDWDSEFDNICRDSQVTFNARELGFIPSAHWDNRELTFGALVSNHFQKKSGSNTRFFHKLYNALKISEFDGFYAEYVGVEWVTDRVIKIDKKKFARLLKIHAIEGSLFHRQGNFPSHGFRELSPAEAKEMVGEKDLSSVDYDSVRLIVHKPGEFMRGSDPQVFEKCRWISSRPK